jgi:hypothetical protein
VEYVQALCLEPNRALDVAAGDEQLRSELLHRLVFGHHLKSWSDLRQAAALLRRHALGGDEIRVDLIEQALALARVEESGLKGVLCDLMMRLCQPLDRDVSRRVFDALDPALVHLFSWLDDPHLASDERVMLKKHLAFAAAEHVLLKTSLEAGPELWRRAIETLIRMSAPAELRELTLRCLNPELAKRAVAYVILTGCDSEVQRAHVDLVSDAGAIDWLELPPVFRYRNAGDESHRPHVNAIALLEEAGPAALARYFVRAEENGNLLVAAIPALRGHTAVGGRLVARYTRHSDHDLRIVARALELLFADDVEDGRIEEREQRVTRAVGEFDARWLFCAFDESPEIESHLTLYLGVNPSGTLVEASSALKDTDAAALIRGVRALVVRQDLDERYAAELIRLWWRTCAGDEERCLALIDATRIRPSAIQPWLDGAPPKGLLPFLRAGARQELADYLVRRIDRVECLRLCVDEAGARELRARARAHLDSLHQDSPPPLEIGELLLTIANQREEGPRQLEHVRAALALAPDVVASEASARYAMHVLLRSAPSDLRERAIDVVLSVMNATPAAWCELRDVLAWEGWTVHGNALDALAAALSPLGVSDVTHLLKNASEAVIRRFACNVNAPVNVRVQAIWTAALSESFDPGRVEISRDPRLVTDLLYFALESGEERPIDYALDRAAWAVVAWPLRNEDLEEQASPAMRLRQLLLHVAAHSQLARHDVGNRIRDQLSRRLRGVGHDKKRLEPSIEIVRAWIEAAGRLRDKRLIGRLEAIRSTLHKQEHVILADTIEHALGEMHRPRLTDPEAELRLVFQALRIDREEVRS